MSNVLSARCWLAAVGGVCKLHHASADGGRESAWRGLWKEIPWLDSSAGVFQISVKPGDGVCTARQAPLSHLSGDAAEKWEESCDPTEGLSAQGRTAGANAWPETLTWQHHRRRFTGGD